MFRRAGLDEQRRLPIVGGPQLAINLTLTPARGVEN